MPVSKSSDRSLFRTATEDVKHWRAASVSAEFALIDFFCIVEYSVLIFSMATDDGLWDLYFNKLPAVEISELIRTRHLFANSKLGFIEGECSRFDLKSLCHTYSC